MKLLLTSLEWARSDLQVGPYIEQRVLEQEAVYFCDAASLSEFITLPPHLCDAKKVGSSYVSSMFFFAFTMLG